MVPVEDNLQEPFFPVVDPGDQTQVERFHSLRTVWLLPVRVCEVGYAVLALSRSVGVACSLILTHDPMSAGC